MSKKGYIFNKERVELPSNFYIHPIDYWDSPKIYIAICLYDFFSSLLQFLYSTKDINYCFQFSIKQCYCISELISDHLSVIVLELLMFRS